MEKWLFLIAGSIAGGVGRYVVSAAVHERVGPGFPYGTLLINISGCLVIGFLAAASDDRYFLNQNSRLMLMTGFCGAYTTFSTYMLETGNLVQEGQIGAAFLNVALSTAAGFAAYLLGSFLAKAV